MELLVLLFIVIPVGLTLIGIGINVIAAIAAIVVGLLDWAVSKITGKSALIP
jgi:hypothetical protein